MIELIVYGTIESCSSCIGAPSPKETADWLYYALNRKFPNKNIKVIHKNEDFKLDFIHPVVVHGEDVISEGNPNLKKNK